MVVSPGLDSRCCDAMGFFRGSIWAAKLDFWVAGAACCWGAVARGTALPWEPWLHPCQPPAAPLPHSPSISNQH